MRRRSGWPYLAAVLLMFGLVGVLATRALGSGSAQGPSVPSVELPQDGPVPVGLQPLAAASPDPHDLKLFETTTLPNGQKLPKVVARVGNTDISATAFVHQVAIVTDNTASASLHWTEGQVWRAALKTLIQDAALYDRAKSEGIVVSDAELSAFIAKQQTALAQAEQTNPEAAARVQAAVVAAGDADYASYIKDPRIRDEYRRALMKGKLVEAHLGPTAKANAVNGFIADTISHANVQIFIVVPA